MGLFSDQLVLCFSVWLQGKVLLLLVVFCGGWEFVLISGGMCFVLSSWVWFIPLYLLRTFTLFYVRYKNIG